MERGISRRSNQTHSQYVLVRPTVSSKNNPVLPLYLDPSVQSRTVWIYIPTT